MRRIPLLLLLLLATIAAGCGSSRTAGSTTATATSGGATVLVGAGSTFVYPLVTRWTGDYARAAGVTLTYGAVGSGAGIAAITDRSVDFGASDAPLSADQTTACGGCVEIPWALGGTSIAYNVPGAPNHLKLDGSTLAGMFLGTITRWNDPAIAKLNPGVRLPSLKITPAFRSDASGTSYNFTDYLSHVSPQWKSQIGTSTQPSFPSGEGGKGSSGVSGIVSHTSGAITYVDVAYAQSAHLQYAAVKNRAGTFVLPTVTSIRAAAAAARAPKPNAAISIVDPPVAAPGAYPIATFTYVLVAKHSAKATALRKFLTYAVTTGQQDGPALLFAPLPQNVVHADEQAIAQIS